MKPASAKSMHDKDPFSYSFIQYAWVVGLAVLGGIVSYLNRLRDESEKVFSRLVFFVEVLTSLFLGLVILFGGSSMGFGLPAIVSIAAVAGSMNSRVMKILQDWLASRFNSEAGPP